MMTTLTDMPLLSGLRLLRQAATQLAKRAAIIGRALGAAAAALSLLGGLSGCSAVRLGYDNGVALAHWWLDSRLDFSEEQSHKVRAALSQWFAWHRTTQLETYAVLLAEARSQGAGSLSPSQLCQWNERLRALADPTLEPLLPAVAEIAATLRPEQIDRLQRRLTDDETRLRREWSQASPQEALEAAIKRSVDRFEGFYGRLNPEQRRILVEAAPRSPFLPERWLAERQWRHQELLQALRSVASAAATPAPGASPVRSPEDWRRLAQRLMNPPQADGGAYRQRLWMHHCDVAAKVHNSASVEQRQAALRKLRGWEQDARELARARPSGQQAAR